MRTQVAELVDKRPSADNGKIIDLHLSGNLGSVGDNHIVSYNTVMRHMWIRHYKAIGTYLCHTFRSCATVYGYAFTNRGVVTYNGNGILTFEFQILRNAWNNGTGKYIAIFTDSCPLHNCDIAADMGSFTDFNILVDGYERFDNHAGMYLCGRMDICKRLFHPI